MGEEERVSAVRDELGLLLDELRSLAANDQAGVHRKSISNLYYAAFHAVRCLLYAHGLDAKTHEGTQRLFAAHFVQPGLFEKAHLKTLGHLESDRLRADYQGYYSFDAADVAMAQGPVLDLVRRTLDYLAEREPMALVGIETQVREAIAGLADPRGS
jgi:uncharacterized protein (UPF0332 family)